MLVHSAQYIAEVQKYNNNTKVSMDIERWFTYASDHTYNAAICAAGCLINLVDSVCENKVSNGFALIRPPGHHAEREECCGFCFFNNIAIATKYAQSSFNSVSKVLILDWDIHHGNGIQHAFYDDPTVLYISLHRYDNGEYFPRLKESDCHAVGTQEGEGYNMNIAWNKDLMGDAEYKAAFDQLVMPVAQEFQPDLVLVACGFDAAAADPLGEYVLTPDIYAYMTEQLLQLANGRVILSLEGGYNTHAVTECLRRCVSVLMGHHPPDDPMHGKYAEKIDDNDEYLQRLSGMVCKRAEQTIATVKKFHKTYWRCLQNELAST